MGGEGGVGRVRREVKGEDLGRGGARVGRGKGVARVGGREGRGG
jgi:hypothetical protein